MTITEANAANVVADDALNLAKHGVPIMRNVVVSIGVLLDGAHRKLNAGHDGLSFDRALGEIVRNARRERRKAARV